MGPLLCPPASTIVVFGTNVLASAFVFQKKAKQVYQYYAERYTLCTTDWLLSELKDVLRRAKFNLPTIVQSDILAQVRADTTFVHSANELPTDSFDPDDNHVLQAAFFADAAYLITVTKSTSAAKKVGNIRIISPTDFYGRLIQ